MHLLAFLPYPHLVFGSLSERFPTSRPPKSSALSLCNMPPSSHSYLLYLSSCFLPAFLHSRTASGVYTAYVSYWNHRTSSHSISTQCFRNPQGSAPQADHFSATKVHRSRDLHNYCRCHPHIYPRPAQRTMSRSPLLNPFLSSPFLISATLTYSEWFPRGLRFLRFPLLWQRVLRHGAMVKYLQ
ncbi:hypothetical protein OF83DRAFT_463378 [Amylostereum chailletii]|nr:hypothetical protein OF83DRAFT_463378 [Amylostereum chailletii]